MSRALGRHRRRSKRIDRVMRSNPKRGHQLLVKNIERVGREAVASVEAFSAAYAAIPAEMRAKIEQEA